MSATIDQLDPVDTLAIGAKVEIQQLGITHSASIGQIAQVAAAGAQSPWVRDIDAASHGLSNLQEMTFSGESAQSGRIRLAHGDSIRWRNVNDSADIGIRTSSDGIILDGLVRFTGSDLVAVTMTGAILTVKSLDVRGTSNFNDNAITAARLDSTVDVTAGLSYDPGARQSFNPDSTAAGINVGAVAGDPSSLIDGDVWYDSTSNKLRARQNGASVNVTGGGASVSPLTTKGDIYTYSTTDARLPVGTNGQILSAAPSAATGLLWINASGASLPLSAKGDLLTYTTDDVRFPLGTDGDVLTVDTAQTSGLVWKPVPPNEPLTTKGDIYIFSSQVDRLPVGTNGQILSATSAAASGLQWITAPSVTLPLDAKGDILTYDTADAKLAVGTNGFVLTADSAAAEGISWKAPARLDPLTTQGDLYTYSTVEARLPVGSDGQILSAQASAATGLLWIDAPSGTLPLTTKGDILAFATSSIRLGVGSTGQVLTVDSTEPTGIKWGTPVAGNDPLTTKGDIFTYATTDARLPVGTNGQILTADSSTTTGLAWVASSGGTLPLTHKGDLLTRTSSADTRLPVGVNNRVLVAASSQDAGVQWGLLLDSSISASARINATKIGTGNVANVEYGYLDGVTSAIQTQLDAKPDKAAVETISNTWTFNTFPRLGGSPNKQTLLFTRDTNAGLLDIAALIFGAKSANNAAYNYVELIGSIVSPIVGAQSAKFVFAVASAGVAYTPFLTLDGAAVTVTFNEKGVFSPSSTVAGINVGSRGGDPSTLVNGDIWYDSTSNRLRARQNGASVNVTGGGSPSPLTTKGDIYTYSTTDARLPVGTNGQILSADSSKTAGLFWIDAPSGTLPLTTKGDILTYSTDDIRLGVGANDQVLTADSSVATGVAWKTPTAGNDPLTTKGDLFTYSTTDARLGVGANGKILSADSSQTTGLAWIDAPSGTLPLTTKGDLLTRTATGDVRFGATSNNNRVLLTASSQDVGLLWGLVADASIAASANINANKLGTGALTNTELNYLNGVLSPIQTQLNAKPTKTASETISNTWTFGTFPILGTSPNKQTLIFNRDTNSANDVAGMIFSAKSSDNSAFNYVELLGSALRSNVNSEAGKFVFAVASAGVAYTPFLTLDGQAVTATFNEKGVFSPSSSVAGINVGSTTADPTVPVNGDVVYVAGTTNKFRFRQQGAWVELGSGGSGDVTGPTTSTNTGIPRWSGTDGDALLNSTVTIDSANNIVTAGNFRGANITATQSIVLHAVNGLLGPNGTMTRTSTKWAVNTPEFTVRDSETSAIARTILSVVKVDTSPGSSDYLTRIAFQNDNSGINTYGSIDCGIATVGTAGMLELRVRDGNTENLARVAAFTPQFITFDEQVVLAATKSITYSVGTKQVFFPSGVNAGINVGARATNPSAAVSGDVYYNSTNNQIRVYQQNAWIALGTGTGDVVGPSASVADTIPLYDGTTGKLPQDQRVWDSFEPARPEGKCHPGADLHPRRQRQAPGHLYHLCGRSQQRQHRQRHHGDGPRRGRGGDRHEHRPHPERQGKRRRAPAVQRADHQRGGRQQAAVRHGCRDCRLPDTLPDAREHHVHHHHPLVDKGYPWSCQHFEHRVWQRRDGGGHHVHPSQYRPGGRRPHHRGILDHQWRQADLWGDSDAP